MITDKFWMIGAEEFYFIDRRRRCKLYDVKITMNLSGIKDRIWTKLWKASLFI